MYPLVIASIAVVAIFIERFNYYKKCRSDTQLITGMLREYIPGGKFDELADALAKDGGIPASVILDGVKCIHLKADQNELIEGASSRAVGELRKYLNYLDTIVTLTPLMGLLGTVIGMVESFNVLSTAQGQPFAITGGVAEALVCTGTGLFVAILSLLAYTYLSQKVSEFIVQIETLDSLYLSFMKGR